jgi:RimJ/RimL family protein N-acetyltransferase
VIELIDEPERFDAAAGALLAARVDCTIPATVLHDVLSGRWRDPPPRFAVVRDGAGVVVGAALRTPPYPMTCTDLTAADAERLVGAWLPHDPGLPGISAVPSAARAIGDAWARRTGGTHRVRDSMALHALDAAADPPRPTTGSLRLAGPGDEAIVIAWSRAFDAEAHRHQDTWRGAEAGRALLAGDRAYLWVDEGEPVSFLGHTAAIDGVPRIGPVYTPPQRRGHGYAGHAVAQLSRRLLAGGARRCVLFTDLANATSNKIYAEVGYRRIADWEQREFVPAAGQAAAESPTTG